MNEVFDTNKRYEYENGFYLTCDTSRMGKLLAHYELYKKSMGVAGDIVECGVYKGASLMRFATFRDLLEHQKSRKIIGFDIFGRFPKTGNIEDDKFIEKFELGGGTGIIKELLEKFMSEKQFYNFELIKGNIMETLPAYTISHPELKISLLHIDVDVYNATKQCLESLYEHVVPNGVIIFDDYACVDGATKAIDEFFKDDKSFCAMKLPYYSVPAYMIKK